MTRPTQIAASSEASPPMRDGVGASAVWLPQGDWPTLLAFLSARFPAIDAQQWRSRFARGLIHDARGTPLEADAPYAPGQHLYYFRELPRETPIPFDAEVLYRDEHLLVADKPHFLPVMPSGRFLQQTLLVRLRRELELPELTPLHRIDRGTAGLVIFSVNRHSRGRYQQLFATRAIDKGYLALAPAMRGIELPLTRRSRLVAGEPFFRMRETGGLPNSETVIEAATPHGALQCYRLRPITGRKHQLRVHMAALGAAIANDPIYPELQDASAEDYDRPLKLLAHSIGFTDPISRQPLRFSSRRGL
jgi:tRNA pseudouridine32 synthase/23S rRNA pseudouridine746 synthase